MIGLGVATTTKTTDGFRFGIAAESENDAQTVTALADRATCAAVDWLDAAQFASMRRWRGLGDADWLDLHTASKRSRAAFGMRAYGKFDGAAGALDARMIRNVLLLFQGERPQPEVVVVARDLDDQPARRTGFQQAMQANSWPFAVVPALAQPEIEAWMLAGFQVEDDAERQRLEDLRRLLGFDPTTQPERLKAGRTTHARDAKGVCQVLTGDDVDRRNRCLDAPLAHLQHAGAKCGLAAFLEGVREAFVPLIQGP